MSKPDAGASGVPVAPQLSAPVHAPKLSGAARAVATLGVVAALVPWVAVAAIVSYGAYYELLWSYWFATYALVALSGDVWGLVFAPIVLIGVVVLGSALLVAAQFLLVTGKLLATASYGAVTGQVDLTLLRVLTGVNVATAIAWTALRALSADSEIREPTLALAACAAFGAALSGLALVMAKRTSVEGAGAASGPVVPPPRKKRRT